MMRWGMTSTIRSAWNVPRGVSLPVALVASGGASTGGRALKHNWAMRGAAGDHLADDASGGSWRWFGRRGSFAQRLLLSYGLVVLVDVAVFASTGLYMTPARLPGTPSDRAYNDAVFANQLEAVVFGALISLLVGAIAAALIPRLLLDPLRQLRRSTRSLMQGQYTESVARPRVPELTDLVQNVNVLAARLADLEVRRA